MTHEQFVRQLTPEMMAYVVKRIKPYADYFVRSANKKAALRALYVEADAMYTNIAEDIRREVKCKKGCAFCCHIRAVSTPIEAEVAVDYAAEHGIEIDTDRLEQQKDLDVDQYMFSPHKRCVFLQPDNTCGIYPVRPFACRTYFVVNDPEFCDVDRHPHHEQQVVNNLEMSYPAMAVLREEGSLESFPHQLLKKIKMNKGIV